MDSLAQCEHAMYTILKKAKQQDTQCYRTAVSKYMGVMTGSATPEPPCSCHLDLDAGDDAALSEHMQQHLSKWTLQVAAHKRMSNSFGNACALSAEQ